MPDAELRLRSEVETFYVRRLKALDAGDAAAWAASFTADGTFSTNARPEPSRGRRAIEEQVRAAHVALVERGAHRRHWLGMLSVETGPGEGIRTDFYAAVYEIVAGGGTTLMATTTGEGVLELSPSGLLVREERIRRDDLVPVSPVSGR